jgi:hypothetical protein
MTAMRSVSAYSPSPGGRGRGEGEKAAGWRLVGQTLPYAEVKIALEDRAYTAHNLMLVDSRLALAKEVFDFVGAIDQAVAWAKRA